jgi:hypothetical protein
MVTMMASVHGKKTWLFIATHCVARNISRGGLSSPAKFLRTNRFGRELNN